MSWSCHSESHPFPVMRQACARSRKRHGGLTPVAKNSCRSETDPIVAVSLFWHGLRMKRPASLLMLSLMACAMEPPRNEVARTNSPDGQTSAVLFETNGGATTSYGYLVELSDLSDQDQTPTLVGKLYGAVRSDCAYGVDVGWKDAKTLTLTVESAEQINVPEQVSIGRKLIRVIVRTGIKNNAAPCGGMAVSR